jgi:hypothetical protein
MDKVINEVLRFAVFPLLRIDRQGFFS